jgi:hypothetical protein
MSQLQVAESNVAVDATAAPPPYVPPLERTEGQPPPIAANGGLSYMSFDQDGDAGTARAIEDALAEIAVGDGQRVTGMIENAPPGPIRTRWGLAFRDYDECVKYIRESNSRLHGPRPAELFHRPVQRDLEGSLAHGHRGGPAQERGEQPAAGPLFPAGAARRAAHR